MHRGTFLKFQVYSLNPLPKETRKNFVLLNDPYLCRSFDYEVFKFFEDLSILFYRDSKHGSEGILIPSDFDTENEEGWEAYKSSGVLTRVKSSLQVLEYPEPKGIQEFQEKQEYVKKYDDYYHWLYWNEKKIIKEMSSKRVIFL